MKNIFIRSSGSFRRIFDLFIDTMIYWNTNKIAPQAKRLDRKFKLLTSSLITKRILVLMIFIIVSLSLNAQDKADETLPVELVYFFAEVYEDSILLKFGTATEVSNYGFEIHRAQNNLNFEVIGFVDGNGNSNSPKDYYYLDSTVIRSGIVYYRLRQIDFNGSFEFSDTISVDFFSGIILDDSEIPAQLLVSNNYPNPFNSDTRINFELPTQQDLKIILFDIQGKLIKEIISRNFYPGAYQLTLDFSNHPSGVYFVRFEMKNNLITKQLILIK